MESQNPYQSPPSVAADASSNVATTMHDSGLGFEFESDWSTEGIKLRRSSPWHRTADVSFAVLTIIWITSLVMAFGVSDRMSGLACLLSPAWIIAGIAWLSNLIHRNGGTFAKVCRGLNGRVRGRVDSGYITIQGPTLSLATRAVDCARANWNRHGAVFRPPWIMESLQVIETDIGRTWTTSHQVTGKADPSELLSRLLTAMGVGEDHDRVVVGGLLRGSDFRGQTCWRMWHVAGFLFSLIGLAGIAWSLQTYMNLPHWVLNPPGHYMLSDAENGAISQIIFFVVISVVFLGIGIWQWTRTLTSFGESRVVVTDKMVAIANDRVALAYHGDALGHFVWTEHGITVRGGTGKVVHLIPARWFDASQLSRVSSWLLPGESDFDPAQENHYVGPSI